MTFGDRLRTLRKELGIICRYEKNVTTPKFEFLINLWKRYRININWLLTGSYGTGDKE